MSHRCQSVLLGQNGRCVAEIASLSVELKNGHVIVEHSHPEAQLLFASEGVMTVNTEQGVWVVPPLRAVWIPADTSHSVVMSGPVSMRTLYFSPKLCRGFPRKCFVMNVSSLLKELILHACTFAKLHKRNRAERRIVEIIIDLLPGCFLAAPFLIFSLSLLLLFCWLRLFLLFRRLSLCFFLLLRWLGLGFLLF